MPSLLSYLVFYLEKHKGVHLEQTEQVTLLDQSYKVVKGTVRTKPDYDDAWLLALSLNSKKVFDIGCNIGQSALLILQSRSIREIVLIDPEAGALATAAKNLIMNGFSSKARFICAFVSGVADENISFNFLPGGAASSMYSSHATSASHFGSQKIIRTTTIDQLANTLQIKPDLVKIDTEGAEHLVLDGAAELAKDQTVRFLVEMHSNPELSMERNAEYILDWCSRSGYKAYYLKNKLEITSPDPIKHRGRCHLLLLPKEENIPEYLLHLDQGAPLNKVLHNKSSV